jgi:hypothetical protein
MARIKLRVLNTTVRYVTIRDKYTKTKYEKKKVNDNKNLSKGKIYLYVLFKIKITSFGWNASIRNITYASFKIVILKSKINEETASFYI